MAKGQTIVLRNDASKAAAHRLIDCAPFGHVANIAPPTRSNAQNDKMWAMLSDVSRAKPDGRCHVPELWKALFMQSCGHQVQYMNGLDGLPFPVGFRSSRLSKEQMSELIECIYEYGARHGVVWTV